MYKNTAFEILEMMDRYGGGFIKALATCYRHADNENKRKLAVTFEDYFKQYDEMHTQRMERIRIERENE